MEWKVTLYVRVWIETPIGYPPARREGVTLYVRVWIETTVSTSARECGTWSPST